MIIVAGYIKILYIELFVFLYKIEKQSIRFIYIIQTIFRNKRKRSRQGNMSTINLSLLECLYKVQKMIFNL